NELDWLCFLTVYKGREEQRRAIDESRLTNGDDAGSIAFVLGEKSRILRDALRSEREKAQAEQKAKFEAEKNTKALCVTSIAPAPLCVTPPPKSSDPVTQAI